MKEENKKKFTCPFCKKTSEHNLIIKFNYCPFCSKPLSSGKIIHELGDKKYTFDKDGLKIEKKED